MWEPILHRSLMILQVFWALSVFVLGRLFKYTYIVNGLEDKDTYSFQSKEPVCLLSCVINTSSPSRAKLSQVCLRPTGKGSGSLNSVFFSCDINPLHVKNSPKTTSCCSHGTWGQEELTRASRSYWLLCAVKNEVSWIWSSSLFVFCQYPWNVAS